MKHHLKKNQVIITALAVMVAVAGYLNYSGLKFEKDATSVSWDSVEVETEGILNTALINLTTQFHLSERVGC